MDHRERETLFWGLGEGLRKEVAHKVGSEFEIANV